MNRCLLLVVSGLVFCQIGKAQSDAKETIGFWANSYVQMGLDMSLQNPYGHDFKDVFPNGKTFGVNVAIGKWFSPQFGLKARLNWENGIRLMENGHATWLPPFGVAGGNMDKGGNVSVTGDVELNLQNIFGAYDADRRWNVILHPRAGAIYSFGSEDGSPLLGLGLENTYRLSDRWSIALDVAYNMVSGAVVDPGNTGVGSGSNGFFDLMLSAQVDLGKKSELKTQREKLGEKSRPFWSDWFLQAGLDMSLQNPYGYNFAEVFPNGKSYGVNLALGKWFTPDVAVRGKLNWENGLIENKHIKWVPPVENPRDNYSEHGYVVATMDVLLNMHNLIGGCDDNRRWSMILYPRAGIISHFGIGSGSPLVGAGIENQYRLNDKWGLYADVDYQVTTSESGVGTTGANSGSNGFFKVELGITYDLR